MRTSLSIISPPTRSSKSHCGQFLRQIENQEIQAFTSTHVAAEAAHRLLTLEARARFRWSAGKVVQRLKQNPTNLQNSFGFGQPLSVWFNRALWSCRPLLRSW